FALINHYGPTENTVVSTCARVEPGGRELPPIGRPLPNNRLYLLDRLRPVPLGVAGELCVAGPGLARGYYRRPRLTAERFIPDPYSPYPGGRLYRTGDLARYLGDGNVDFLGRIDFQVKVRGFRIELGEIEVILAQHPGVREAVVLARPDETGDLRLVAYAVPECEPAPAAAELRTFCRRQLPEYMLPAAFDFLAALPVTPNGKVDRAALGRRPLPALRRDTAAAPRTPTEAELAAIWSAVLGQATIADDDDFFELGGHSLLATRVLSRIRDVFAVELTQQALYAAPTVAALARRIETRRREAQGLTAPPLTPAPRTGELPLSFAEQRMWFFDRLQPASTLYHVCAALRLRGRLALPALAHALVEIVRRHEILRTVYPERDGRPVRVVRPPGEVALPLVNLERLGCEARKAVAQQLAEAELERPFDLAVGPLLRWGLVRLDGDDHRLWFAVHRLGGAARGLRGPGPGVPRDPRRRRASRGPPRGRPAVVGGVPLGAGARAPGEVLPKARRRPDQGRVRLQAADHRPAGPAQLPTSPSAAPAAEPAKVTV
ncbi:MAG: AMP-binding protein, partial [bacterium]|nr:AMP-binding protein [bacterium]